jgi:hypothetical protein
VEDDGGLGEELGMARAFEAQVARRSFEATRRGELDGEAAFRKLVAAGRAFVARAREIGVEVGEYQIAVHQPMTLFRDAKTVWTAIPVYVVGGFANIHVDLDGVVYSPRPTNDCAFGPHNLHSGMAKMIIQEMAAFLARTESELSAGLGRPAQRQADASE